MTVNDVGYIVLNYDLLISKDMEGGSHGLFQGAVHWPRENPC